MSDFQGMEDLLQDFLVEATDLLSEVDNKLVDLERAPQDRGLLNDIFRGFHTIKGGAGFLNASELVTLCHLTENLFDKLRNGELQVTPENMDVILASTGAVRDMFGYLEQGVQPHAADPALIESLRQAIAGTLSTAPAPAPAVAPAAAPAASTATAVAPDGQGLDWGKLMQVAIAPAETVPAVVATSAPVVVEAEPAPVAAAPAPAPKRADKPPAAGPRRDSE